MERKHSLRPGEIPGGAMGFIARGLSEIDSGRIVLTAQDSRLVSVEREERIGGDALFAARSGKEGAAIDVHCRRKSASRFRICPTGRLSSH